MLIVDMLMPLAVFPLIAPRTLPRNSRPLNAPRELVQPAIAHGGTRPRPRALRSPNFAFDSHAAACAQAPCGQERLVLTSGNTSRGLP